MRNKLAIIGTVGLPANYGGFETLAENLVDNLGAEYDISVYCTSTAYKKRERKKKYKGARLFFLPFKANGVQSIIYDTFSILHALFYADILLVLGVSGAWILPFVRVFTNKKIVVSIDGIEWKRGKWSPKIRLFLWLSEYLAVKYSHLDISDNLGIQAYTAKRYGSLSRVVEYGADHIENVEITPEALRKYQFLSGRYTFSVCRIEPENNVEMILNAFANMPSEKLVLVGNWDSSAFSREMRSRFSKYDHMYLLDAIYDQKELDLLRGNASIYIHGHSAGGTNPSLVEAMMHGLSIFAFDVIYNRVTTENQAHYFGSEGELKHKIMTTPLMEHKAMAIRMKAIADKRYTWKYISAKYHSLFAEAILSRPKTTISPAVIDSYLQTLVSRTPRPTKSGSRVLQKLEPKNI